MARANANGCCPACGGGTRVRSSLRRRDPRTVRNNRETAVTIEQEQRVTCSRRDCVQNTRRTFDQVRDEKQIRRYPENVGLPPEQWPSLLRRWGPVSRVNGE